MAIGCAFTGRAGANAMVGEGKNGKPFARFSICVAGRGEEPPEWIQCIAFDEAAEAVADLQKGERCYIEGVLRLNRWEPESGDMRANLTCVATKVVIMERIGRRRRRLNKRADATNAAERSARQLEELNDPISF